jgi:hypothetical protein
LLVLASAGRAVSADAASLIEGRYLSDAFQGTAPTFQAVEPHAHDGVELGPRVLTFTPRGAVRGRAGDGTDAFELPTLHFDLSQGSVQSHRLDLLSIAGPRLTTTGVATVTDSESMLVGGAVEWSDWRIGGSFFQASSGASDMQMLGASVGYGRISAGFAYGLSESTAESADRDFFMFSTNLAARPWLTLEGDIGYMPGEVAEPQSTVGRLGVRLRF